MQRAILDDITLEYDVIGRGDSIVFIHGAFVADAFRPLVAEPSLTQHYRLITYHRRGYVGSSRSPGPVSVAQQAADCRALLEHIGVSRAHVVGHSFGACVALQLALDTPEMVRSMALLEPALMLGTTAQSYRESLIRNARRYREVGAEVVVHEALEARWPEYRDTLDLVLPGAFAQAVADAATVFEMDIGHVDWPFGEAEARRITQPVLSVLGEKSEALWARFGEVHRMLMAWMPRAEGFVLPGGTHFLHVESPNAAAMLAEAIAAFCARHPADSRGQSR